MLPWGSEETSAPPAPALHSGVHLCSGPSLNPHEGERRYLEAKRRAALQGWVWGCRAVDRRGPHSNQDPRPTPKPTLALTTNPVRRRLRQISDFIGEEVEAQIGAFTCSRSPAGGAGAGFTPLTGSKKGALSTSHKASSSSSAHPGERTPADRDGVRSAHPAKETPDLPSQNRRRNSFPGDKGQSVAAIRWPAGPLALRGVCQAPHCSEMARTRVLPE